MAATAEYVVRMSNDSQSADNRLADLEKSEDTFREKLVKLIADQQKVNQAVEKMTGKYSELTEKIQAAKVAAGEKPTASPLPQDPKDPAANKPIPKLDPESEKALDQLRKDLAELAKDEQKNTQAAQDLEKDLNKMADESGKNALLPADLKNEMKLLPNLFEQSALKPLQDLVGKMQKGATPNPRTDPNLDQIAKASCACRRTWTR